MLKFKHFYRCNSVNKTRGHRQRRREEMGLGDRGAGGSGAGGQEAGAG